MFALLLYVWYGGGGGGGGGGGDIYCWWMKIVFGIKFPTDNKSALVLEIAWCQTGD